MTPQIILNFLLPQSADLLQWVFLTVIFLMLTATIVSTHRSAQVPSWEKNWNRNGGNYAASDSLGIEHGSVTDLWHAVATPPEKLAEAMPGMLLMVGLLGTFIGLGVALNHASEILGQSNALAAGNAANSMQDLLGLLQGLGTKFKTSTWGILGFIILKIWSETTRFDDKRLNWVILKVKVELEKRSEMKERKEEKHTQLLFNQMGSSSNLLINAITTQGLLQINAGKIHHEQSLAAAFDIRNAIITMHTALPEAINQSTSRLDERLESIHTETENNVQAVRGTEKVMREFIDESKSVMERMADGSKAIGDGANKMNATIDSFETKFTSVLDDIASSLTKSINDLGEKSKEGSGKIESATQNVATVLESTMNNINSAIARQATSLTVLIKESGDTNEKLQESAGAINKLVTPIVEGLQAISASNRNMAQIGSSVKEAADRFDGISKKIADFPDFIAPLGDLHQSQRDLVDTLKKVEPSAAQLQTLLEELRSFREALFSILNATSFSANSKSSKIDAP
jgi:ABC-type transporter Mla subunit MlaD